MSYQMIEEIENADEYYETLGGFIESVSERLPDGWAIDLRIEKGQFSTTLMAPGGAEFTTHKSGLVGLCETLCQIAQETEDAFSAQ